VRRLRQVRPWVVVGAVLALAAGAVGVVRLERAGAAVVHAQWVTVSAPSSTSTYATVEAWQLQPDGRYKRMARFPSARVGALGVGPTREGVARTPTGRYRLSQPFGIKPNPGVSTSYFQVDRDDVWTSSTGTVINQHRRCAPGTCPAGYGQVERLSNHPGLYDYGVFIGYNAPPPYGTGAARNMGSAFFLHVKNAYPTAGCVAVSAAEMLWLLRWFRSSAAPAIAIGVGSAAYNPIPNRYV
jgi:L,D-peptidoglycan transpeptidase YkuD (ErfK/YbiS/YcfS/YnhG family)